MADQLVAPRAAVFDLDGTLVDSVPDLHAAANRMLAEMDLKSLDLPIITSFVGNGIPMLVKRTLQAAGADVGAAREAEAVTRYKELYAQEPALRTLVYPGVEDGLRRLAASGCRLGVCTNKAEALARAVLRDMGLASYFEVLIGGDTLPTHKPDPEGLLHAIALLGASVPSALYIGDSEVDAATAKAASVRFAIFEGGYRKTPIEDLEHWRRFTSLDRLAGELASA